MVYEKTQHIREVEEIELEPIRFSPIPVEPVIYYYS
jgi:hypothetical protein